MSKTNILPNIQNLEDYKSFDLRGASVVEATHEVLHRLNIPLQKIEFPKDGSSPVAIIDNKLVLKFFAPLFFESFDTERRSLKFTSRLSPMAPKYLDSGVLDEWNYVLMSKLEGRSLKNMWPELSAQEIEDTCFTVGQNLKKIHELPILKDDFKPFDWQKFIDGQRLSCVSRHEKLGLDPNLVAQIPSFLASVELVTGPMRFLHTEIAKEHVFFQELGEDLKFSGFLDFEPAMLGEAEYDFASVGIFLSSGHRHALRAFFAGYGNLKNIDRNFQRRALAYTLLHRYSNIKWYLDFMPNAHTLDELAELWWAI